MSTHHSSEMTLFPNPLHTSELRALPQYRIGNGSVLRGESLQELFRVQQIMRDLVPTGVDDTRTLWIETLRGDPAGSVIRHRGVRSGAIRQKSAGP